MTDRSSELAAAVDAVRAAARVCRAVQARLVTAETLEKKDKSPVTVADFASQAIVCAKLWRPCARWPSSRRQTRAGGRRSSRYRRPADGRQLLEPLYALLGEARDSRDLSEAKALLEQLGS